MAEEAYVLTERDRAIVAETIRQVEILIGRSLRGRGDSFDISDVPIKSYMYMARTPSGGIPALDQNMTGTGTVDLGDDEPSYADCEVYTIMHQYTPPKLRPTGFTVRVYSVLTVAIPGYQWVGVMRDEYGDWWVPPIPLVIAECP